MALTPDFRSALVLAVVQQVAAGVLCALAYDGTPLLRIWGFTSLAFWTGVVLVAWRRPSHPTRTDLLLIKFGFIPLFVGAGILAGFVWRATRAF